MPKKSAKDPATTLKGHVGHLVIFYDGIPREGKLIRVCEGFVWVLTGGIARRVPFSALRDCECSYV
jgi:hypothetical protein